MEDSGSNWSGRNVRIFVGLFIFSAILGFISFHFAFPGFSFFRKLYLTLQLFTIESGDKFYDATAESTLWSKLGYNAARFGAAVTTVYAIVVTIFTFLDDWFLRKRIGRMKGHIILCGFGDIGKSVYHSSKHLQKFVVIEKDIENENLYKLRREGVKVIRGNARNSEVLLKAGFKKAKCIYALTGDDYSNITIMHRVIELAGKDPGNTLYLAVNIDNKNLKEATTNELYYSNTGISCELLKLKNDFVAAAKSLAEKKGFVSEKDAEEKYKQAKDALMSFPAKNRLEKSVNINGKNSLIIRLFNINEISARHIIRNYPPDRFWKEKGQDTREVHILILGYSQLGEELFKQLAFNCHYIVKGRTRITILCNDATYTKNKVIAKHNSIDKVVDLQFIDFNPHHLTKANKKQLGLDNLDIIYICSDQDSLQMSYTSKANEVFGKQIPVVRWFGQIDIVDNSQDESLNTCTIEIFDDVARHENIIGGRSDALAAAMHQNWLEAEIPRYVEKVEQSIALGRDIPEPKEAMRTWPALNEEYRDDNRSVAEHNFVKLRMAGWNILPDRFPLFDPSSVNFDFLENMQLVEGLAKTEHDRWMATRFYYGWQFNPNRNDEEKEHDNLIDFNDLDESIKEYDRKQIRDLKIFWDLCQD